MHGRIHIFSLFAAVSECGLHGRIPCFSLLAAVSECGLHGRIHIFSLFAAVSVSSSHGRIPQYGINGFFIFNHKGINYHVNRKRASKSLQARGQLFIILRRTIAREKGGTTAEDKKPDEDRRKRSRYLMRSIRRNKTAGAAAAILTAAMAVMMTLTACTVAENGPKQISYINNNTDDAYLEARATDKDTAGAPEQTPDHELTLWEKFETGEYLNNDQLDELLEEIEQEIESQHQKNLAAFEQGFLQLKAVRPGVADENYEKYFLGPYVKFYEEARGSIDDFGYAYSGAANLRFMGGTGASGATARQMIKYALNVLEQLKEIEAIIPTNEERFSEIIDPEEP